MISNTENCMIVTSSDGSYITLSMGGAMLPAFKSLVQRAMNTWADAPPELKEFADLILDGKVQQDYHSQV